MKIPDGIRYSLEECKEARSNCFTRILPQIPVDAAGGHRYQISTAMQVYPVTSLGGVRLSNAWSIYRREGDNLGKLRTIPYRLNALEGALA